MGYCEEDKGSNSIWWWNVGVIFVVVVFIVLCFVVYCSVGVIEYLVYVFIGWIEVDVCYGCLWSLLYGSEF